MPKPRTRLISAEKRARTKSPRVEVKTGRTNAAVRAQIEEEKRFYEFIIYIRLLREKSSVEKGGNPALPVNETSYLTWPHRWNWARQPEQA